MKSTKSSSKRKTLKILALGGVGSVAAPTSWKKPVIESVALPAHAVMTAGGGDGTGGTTTPAPFVGQFFGDIDSLLSQQIELGEDETLIAKLERSAADWVMDSAHANGTTTHICIDVNGSSFDAQLQIKGIYYTLSGTVGSPLTNMTQDCHFGAGMVQLSVNPTPGPGGAPISVRFDKNPPGNTNIPLAACTFEFGCVGE